MNLTQLEQLAHKMATLTGYEKITDVKKSAVPHEDCEEIADTHLSMTQTAPLKNRPFSPKSYQKRPATFNK